MLRDALKALAFGPLVPLSHELRPMVKFENAARSVADVEHTWRRYPDAGIGVLSQPSRLIVIDVESPKKKPGTPDGMWTLFCLQRELGPLPPTRMHRTKSGGVHCVYRVHEELRASQGKLRGGKQAPGVDIVAGNQVLRWPPTTGYKLHYHVEISTLPEVWLEALRDPPTPQRSEQSNIERMSAYVDKVVANFAGLAAGRMVALNSSAYSLGRTSLSEAQIESALLRACEANGALREHGERSCRATIRRGAIAGAKRSGGLR